MTDRISRGRHEPSSLSRVGGSVILTTPIHMKNMRARRINAVRGLIFCAVAVLLLAGAGCEGTPIGPSLASTPLTNLDLKPTFGDPNACCCHVTGIVTNNNSVAVHVSIKFSAFQSATAPDPFASILYFIEDLQPRASHNVDAAGFLIPCSTINKQLLRTELSVRGVTFPAQ